jgi:hypothetical protein
MKPKIKKAKDHFNRYALIDFLGFLINCMGLGLS